MIDLKILNINNHWFAVDRLMIDHDFVIIDNQLKFSGSCLAEIVFYPMK